MTDIMKTATRAIPITRALLLGLLSLTLPTGCRKASSDDKPMAAAMASQLAQDLMGTWVHVGRPGQVGEPPAAGGRLKFRTGRHWTLTHAGPGTGLVTEHFGGTYTVQGNEYVETQDYADSTYDQETKITGRALNIGLKSKAIP